jgi:hypothetical protein
MPPSKESVGGHRLTRSRRVGLAEATPGSNGLASYTLFLRTIRPVWYHSCDASAEYREAEQ